MLWFIRLKVEPLIPKCYCNKDYLRFSIIPRSTWNSKVWNHMYCHWSNRFRGPLFNINKGLTSLETFWKNFLWGFRSLILHSITWLPATMGFASLVPAHGLQYLSTQRECSQVIFFICSLAVVYCSIIVLIQCLISKHHRINLMNWHLQYQCNL